MPGVRWWGEKTSRGKSEFEPQDSLFKATLHEARTRSPFQIGKI
jgi:hypothetical protein